MNRINQFKFSLLYVLYVLYVLFFTFHYAFSQTKDDKSSDSVEGETSFYSHFVYKGLSQTNNDPSIQTRILFPIVTPLKIGLWGSNVNYEGFDDHVWIKGLVELKLDFNKDVYFLISYQPNQFFKSKIRNGVTTHFNLNIFDYNIIYDLDTNWNGTETHSVYYAFNKTYQINNNIYWLNQVGYTTIEVTDLQNYFDFKSSLSYVADKLNVELAVTATSNPSQFNGSGDVFTYIGTGFKY